MAILLATFGGSPSSWGVHIQGKFKTAEKSPSLASSSDDGGEEETPEMAPMPCLNDLLGSDDDVFVRRSSSHVLFVGKGIQASHTHVLFNG